MNTKTHDLEKRLTQLRKAVLARGFDRYVSLLRSVSELPDELQSPTVTALAARDSVQSLILFPQQIQHGWEYVPRQALLFTPTSLIQLVASIWPNQEPQVTRLDGRGLLYMKVTLLLLYGFLEIVAQGEASAARVGLEFNTVAWHRLSPPLRQLLRAAQTRPEQPADQRSAIPDPQPALAALPLKYSNGVKLFGLLPGETLEALVFQPGVWRPRLLFFRQPLLAHTLLLLTSNFVAVIQEELGARQGWIISYIPRDSIVGIRHQPGSLWDELTIQLKRGDQTAEYRLRLRPKATEAWRTHWVDHGGQWQDPPSRP